MTDDLKPYVIVRVVGQEEFEEECCQLMKLGYVPSGGPTAMTVVHPLTNQASIGFLQAMAIPIPIFPLPSRN